MASHFRQSRRTRPRQRSRQRLLWTSSTLPSCPSPLLKMPHQPNQFTHRLRRRSQRKATGHILAAIRTLKTIEHQERPATREERQTLGRFAGFGPVALSIFPDPVTGNYKDGSWQDIGGRTADAPC